MSKIVKQLQIDTLKQTFASVRDFVVLSISKMDAISENTFRRSLRKKKVRVHGVKNSLARRAFDDMGIKIPLESPYWSGPTAIAFGTSSLGELSRALDSEIKDVVKKNAKLKEAVKIKGAVLEGQEVNFDLALKMPTRLEAIGAVLAAILGPASQIAGQIIGPASQVAGQIKTISERKEEEAPAAAPA
jgi:large subunit ribosomal protein L10